MKRQLYYRAFLLRGDWEYPKYEWFLALVDLDKVDEYLTEIQIEHMKNRLIGGWRWNIPFCVEWKEGDIQHLDYNI